MVLQISIQETQRPFCPLNRPDSNTNVRHRAVLHKALELFSIRELTTIFGWPIKLRVVMGSASTFSQLGKIQTHHVHNSHLVSRETTVPNAEARRALRAYRDAYDAYLMEQGNIYHVRNEQAMAALQAAEKAWHGHSLSCRGSTAPPHPRRTQQAFPTPPPSSTVRGDARARAPTLIPVDPRLPALIPVGSRLLPIDLTSDVGERLPKKRKISAILDVSDIIDVSDSEDET
ncbi:hypothetical protein B0H17DRAFT_1193879 [Mycena rosella]|uniref:Uncharacterized protein n=1 Tax=Mycena rosella TaxID=1033263 RepID=A0AAD7GRY6_MYCRO|nr:hypothetical protein B0H17DRAFT_1193879 [Mycena rosella]